MKAPAKRPGCLKSGPSAAHGVLPKAQRLTPNAPSDWHYHLFPLEAVGEETLSLDWVTDAAMRLMERGVGNRDEAEYEAVPHWAHLLKLEQGPEGDWPAVVNARTGEALGAERTRKPAAMLARLGELLSTTEFEAAVTLARARNPAPVAEP
jgi:hypothetical protein